MLDLGWEGEPELDQNDHLFLQGGKRRFFKGPTMQRQTVECIIHFIDFTEEKLAMGYKIAGSSC